MSVLGLDPGLANLGWAEVDGITVLAHGKLGTEKGELTERVLQLSVQIAQLDPYLPPRPFSFVTDAVVETYSYPPGSMAAAKLAAALGTIVGVMQGRVPVHAMPAGRMRHLLGASKGRKVSKAALGLTWPKGARPSQHEVDAAGLARAWILAQEGT